MHHAWPKEDDLKNEDNLKHEDDLNNEVDLKNESKMKNEDILKIKDDTKNAHGLNIITWKKCWWLLTLTGTAKLTQNWEYYQLSKFLPPFPLLTACKIQNGPQGPKMADGVWKEV